MTSKNIKGSFRVAAKKVGLINGNPNNPLRLKQFRHIFRTAAALIHVDKAHTQDMMGRRMDGNEEYAPTARQTYLPSLIHIEKLIEVYGGNDEGNGTEFRNSMHRQNIELAQQSTKTRVLEEIVSKQTKELQTVLTLVRAQHARLVEIADNFQLILKICPD